MSPRTKLKSNKIGAYLLKGQMKSAGSEATAEEPLFAKFKKDLSSAPKSGWI